MTDGFDKYHIDNTVTLHLKRGMNNPIHTIVIANFIAAATIYALSPTAAGWPTLEEALDYAGDNRGELEEALRRLPERETELLIRTARQYDRVNLTAGLLVDNINYARLAFREMPYANKRYSYEIWRDWVLPYRILDEDLESWRPRLYSYFAPMVQRARGTAQAVQIISDYLWERQGDGQPRLIFEVSENRNQTPLQMLHNRRGGCKEMHLAFIAILRAVGIPARHCTVTWWVNGDWFHYFMEYWDPDRNRWVPMDFSTRTDPVQWQQQRSSRNLVKAYAFPAYPPVADIEGQQLWEHCIDITDHILPTGELEITLADSENFRATAYVWNLGSWRVIDYTDSNTLGVARMRLGDTANSQPILITAVAGDTVGWGYTEVTAGRTTPVLLQPERNGEGSVVQRRSRGR